MLQMAEIRNDFQLFIETLDSVCNGATFIGAFNLQAKNTLSENLETYLLSGQFTEQLFLLDKLSNSLNYAYYDPEVDDFVYPDIKNYFTKLPLSLRYQQIPWEAAMDLYKNHLTSSKSPYQQQLQEGEAIAIIRAFFQSMMLKVGEGEPQFHQLTTDFLFAREELTGENASSNLAYFDNGYFDSALVVQFATVAFLVLSNGLP